MKKYKKYIYNIKKYIYNIKKYKKMVKNDDTIVQYIY